MKGIASVFPFNASAINDSSEAASATCSNASWELLGKYMDSISVLTCRIPPPTGPPALYRQWFQPCLQTQPQQGPLSHPNLKSGFRETATGLEMCHCEKEGKGKIIEGLGSRQPLPSLSPENRGLPFPHSDPFSLLFSVQENLSLWLILEIQNESDMRLESGISIYQRRIIMHLSPGSEGPCDNSQWGTRESEVRVHCFPQEHLDKVRGG